MWSRSGRSSRSTLMHTKCSFISAGDAFVLERLALHHVAPVARRVADAEEDRLVLAHARARAPPVPRDTSRRGCARAGGDTGWSRRSADLRGGRGAAGRRRTPPESIGRVRVPPGQRPSARSAPSDSFQAASACNPAPTCTATSFCSGTTSRSLWLVDLPADLLEAPADEAHDLVAAARDGQPVDLAEVEHVVEDAADGRVERLCARRLARVLRRLDLALQGGDRFAVRFT